MYDLPPIVVVFDSNDNVTKIQKKKTETRRRFPFLIVQTRIKD